MFAPERSCVHAQLLHEAACLVRKIFLSAMIEHWEAILPEWVGSVARSKVNTSRDVFGPEKAPPSRCKRAGRSYCETCPVPIGTPGKNIALFKIDHLSALNSCRMSE